MIKITSAEEYIEVNSHFSEALNILRSIINSTELNETIKWNMPTYCLNRKNILGIGAFKNHFCIWFHQGVFLKDEHELLYNAQEGKTKAMRQMRFISKEAINETAVLIYVKEARQMRFISKEAINETAVLIYVKEAIENHRLGRELKPNRNTAAVMVPKELKIVINKNLELKNKFNALSPSHQREYCNYITEAKREETKLRRIEKIVPMIIFGKGLNDKYKNC